MASGCGEAEVVHFTRLSHVFFLLQSPTGVLFPVQHTRHLSLFSRPLEDDGLLSYNVWTSGDITIKTKRGFLLTKLKEVAEIRGGEEGQVPSCGLRLSWVMKEPPPPLLPLEKLTGYSHMKTAQPCQSSCQRQLTSRGGKTLFMSHM